MNPQDKLKEIRAEVFKLKEGWEARTNKKWEAAGDYPCYYCPFMYSASTVSKQDACQYCIHYAYPNKLDEL